MNHNSLHGTAVKHVKVSWLRSIRGRRTSIEAANPDDIPALIEAITKI